MGSTANAPLANRNASRSTVIVKIGRNARCPCGSGKKYKNCHYGKPRLERMDVFVPKAGGVDGVHPTAMNPSGTTTRVLVGLGAIPKDETHGRNWLLEVQSKHPLDIPLLIRAVHDPELTSSMAGEVAHVDWERLRTRMDFSVAISMAERFLPLLNGMLRMQFSGFQELTLKGITGTRDNGGPFQLVWDDVRITTMQGHEEAQRYLQDGGPTLGPVYRLAQMNAALSEALLYFGRRTEPFFGLYKAYEVMVDAIGMDGIRNLGIPINACERFTRAANDPEISGVYARHSKRYADVPQNPMSEFEARQSIARSEERRVGKECRSRWSPYH